MSEIKTDKLTGTSTAGSILVTGEGNSTTTNLQQGLAKAWVNFDATGTPAARDSLNFSSIVDNSAGDFTLNWSSSMANGNYSLTGMTENFGVASTTTCVLGVLTNTFPATSSVTLTTVRTDSSSTTERDVNCASIFGDLA
jgi:hypothetical protein